MSNYQIITAEQAKALIRLEPVTILDLRDARSYRAEHIDGALLYHDALEQVLVERAQIAQPLLLYCYRGVTSKEKAAHFAQLGFRRVYSLENGFSGWPRPRAAAVG